MEFLVILLIGFVLIGSLLGWIGYLSTRRAERRIAKLESELRRLREGASPVAPPVVAQARPPDAPAASVGAPPPMPVPAAPPPIRAAPKLVGETPAEAAQGWSSKSARATEPAPVPPAPPAAKPAFDLERWLGVRGAAVLGGVFMIIAGFLFLQHSIERGWVTPSVRLIVGALTGIVCLFVARLLRPRGYEVLANSLTGVGVVLLYAVAWAAHVVYGRIEFLTAFAAMVAVTALCVRIAYLRSSQLVAVLGFVGGFATPLALSAGLDRPLGLFGYALLLDLAFLFVAHRRRWPSIALLGLFGTTLIQALWIFRHMQADALPLALGVLAAFGLVFAVFTSLQPREERARWIPSQIGALLLPFAFAAYFAQHVALGSRILPLAAVAAAMTIGAGVLGRIQSTPWLSLGCASGSLALLFVWIGVNAPELAAARAWELVIAALGLALIQHVFAELAARARPPAALAVLAGATLSVGLVIACAFAAATCSSVPIWPWILAFALLPLALFRQTALGAHFAAAPVATFFAGAGLAVWMIRHDSAALLPPATISFAILLGLSLLFLAAAAMRRTSGRAPAFWAAAAFVPPALLAAAHGQSALLAPSGFELAATFLLGFSMAAAATGARSSVLFAIAIIGTLLAQLHGSSADVAATAQAQTWTRVMLIACAGAGLFSAWPFLRPSLFRALPGFWCLAAISSLPWFGLIHTLVIERHGSGLRFATPLAFTVFLGLLARILFRDGEPEREARERVAQDASHGLAAEQRARHVARIWFVAVALLYASFTLPLHVNRAPFAVGMALFGLALAIAWTRIDSRRLKYLAVASIVLASLSLIGTRWLDAYPRAHTRVFNPQAYLFLLPAISAGATAWLLNSRELVRARGFELRFENERRALSAIVAGTCGVVLCFAWLNLEVADAFAETETFRFHLRGPPRANLAASIAWAVYALVLLGAGVLRGIGGLRWASLILLCLTIAKVFLFDLGHLGGLYRVASMLGLALSLLFVSFLYQRFVFRRRAPA